MAQLKKPVLDRLLEKAKDPDCFIDGDYIVLKIRNGVTYDVPLNKCNTHAKIMGWQFQLTPKRWASKHKILVFTRLACEHHNLPIVYP